MRQLEHRRRYRSSRLEPGDYQMAVERADRSDPIIRQEIAALESAYRIGQFLSFEGASTGTFRVLGCYKCFCTEHEWRVAQFVARVLGLEATLWNETTKAIAYAPGYTIMGTGM